jgi:tRNA(fMet)-specific endonuclease VapC
MPPKLLDTNILVELVRNDSKYIKSVINPNLDDEYISVVTHAEIRSLAYQLNWPDARIKKLEYLLSQFIVTDINNLEPLIKKYAEIDAYGLRKHQALKPKHRGSITMGKNDLWIAATAAVLGIQLLTTDRDFDHLHNVFLDVKLFKPEELKKPSK